MAADRFYLERFDKMNKNFETAFVLPFFGHKPEWASFFLKSVARNKSIHWILFSDIAFTDEIPENVHCIQFTIQDFKELVKLRLGIDAQIEHPYKICDFKPAFGYIFSDYLKNYDYWGYCDFDCVFGDISKFLIAPLKLGAEIITPETTFITGHFCMVKNTEKMNELFLVAENYENVFKSPRCFCFDENFVAGGIELTGDNLKKHLQKRLSQNRWRYIFLQKTGIQKRLRFLKKWIKYNPTDDGKLEDINTIARYLEKQGKLIIFREIPYDSDTRRYRLGEKSYQVSWKNGKLFDREGKEILYYHFPVSKYNKTLKFESKSPDEFTVSGYRGKNSGTF